MKETIDFSLPQESTKIEKPKLVPKPKKRIYTFIDLGGKPDDRHLTQQDRMQEARRERTKEDWKNLLGGIIKTFGTAASGASLLYGGGWSGVRLLNGNKSSSLGQALSKYVLPSNKVDLAFDALQFTQNPSLSSGVEVAVGKGLDKWKDFGSIYRQMSEIGSQGLNANNIISNE